MMGTGKSTGEDRARRAAEAAIACPLLDNVSLKGARGILVNITAGPDLGMDEFAAVGEAISDFASENALVVIGTVLDEGVRDELCVTVVATGLGQAETIRDKDMRLVTPSANGDMDYRRLDMPTVMRKQPPKESPLGSPVAAHAEYLDIPAFLRRQAD
jgi:cell division protein FtsZ